MKKVYERLISRMKKGKKKKDYLNTRIEKVCSYILFLSVAVVFVTELVEALKNKKNVEE